MAYVTYTHTHTHNTFLVQSNPPCSRICPLRALLFLKCLPHSGQSTGWLDLQEACSDQGNIHVCVCVVTSGHREISSMEILAPVRVLSIKVNVVYVCIITCGCVLNAVCVCVLYCSLHWCQ